MFCSHCGAEFKPEAAYCAGCGKPVNARSVVPTQNRVAGHVRLLGIFWLVLSLLRVIPGVFLMLLFRPRFHFLPPDVPPFVYAIVTLLGILLVFFGIAGILTGWGLLNREPWARLLAIVMAFLNLLDLPFRTALSIYTLWVLLPAQSEQEYRQTARTAALNT